MITMKALHYYRAPVLPDVDTVIRGLRFRELVQVSIRRPATSSQFSCIVSPAG